MATVTCKYCGKKFDREKFSYIQIPYGKTFRYGHSECYLKAVNNQEEKEVYQIFDPKEFKNCFWCSQAILPNDPNVIQSSELLGRYMHKSCAAIHPADDREKFKVYVVQLYRMKDDKSLPGYLQRADKMMKDYKFTYSGMMKALEYFHRVKQNPIDFNKEPTPGIIPYVYSQAYKYYYNLWLAQEQNKTKNFEDFIPQDVIVVIPSPKREPQKRNLFSFIEEDLIDAK